MKTNKLLIGGIAGGVVFFLLGWLLYGMLVMDFMMANCGSASGVHKEQMDMWALVVGDFAFGFLFAVIFSMWGRVLSFMEGLKAGALIGVLMCGGFDLIMYGTSNLMTLQGTIVDIAVFTVISALSAGVVAVVMKPKEG